jgi:hypothetical protein
VAGLAVLALAPASAHGQHSKVSLESIGPAGGNGPLPADLAAQADTDNRPYLSTLEALTSADTDSSFDLYSRYGPTTTLATTGSTGGNGAYPALSGRTRAAGTRLFFVTEERLRPEDTDNSLDVYMREGSATTLVSTGPGAGAFGAYDSFFAGASTDGTRVFFTTRGALVGADNDQSFDVYERSSGNTTLVSTGPAGGNGPYGADLAGLSNDGTKVFFHTAEPLVAGDTDTAQDVYQRAGGTTTLLSTGPNGGNAGLNASFDASSQDGTKVFFHTAESLLTADTDTGNDVYERANETTTTIHSISAGGGNSGAAARFVGASQDGSKVFVDSSERLLPSPTDRDSLNDVYMSAGGSLTMITPGGNDTVATNAYFVGASTDGIHVFFRSEEPLIAGDADQYQDVYQYQSGSLSRLSQGSAGGNGPAHALYGGTSDDGTHVYFQTAEALDPADTDTATDVYERYGGTTSLLSLGPAGGSGAFDASFRAVSADGQRVFFQTAESLVAADIDGAPDVYSANVPGTVTVVLDAVPNDPQDFAFQASGLDDGFAFSPPDFGPTSFSLDDDSDGTLSNQKDFTGVTPGGGYSVSQTAATGWDLTSATCDDGSPVTAIDVSAGEHVTCTFTNTRQTVTTGYPRPKGATPVRFSLVPAFQECVDPNRMHGPSLVFASCNPPAREPSELTVGTQDANGVAPNFTGSVRWEAILGIPSTPADEADVRLIANLTDVRLAAGLDDYAGELQSIVTLRITDRDAGVPMTTEDLPLAATVPCNPTANTNIGSSCSLATTVDAILPGAVKETRRTIWQLANMLVTDGGTDGLASTQPNTAFARPGLFVP